MDKLKEVEEFIKSDITSWEPLTEYSKGEVDVAKRILSKIEELKK